MLEKIIGGALGSFFGPTGKAVGVAIGHSIDSSIENTESTTLASIPSQTTFNEKLLHGTYFVKEEVFALSLYSPVSVDRELHNSEVFKCKK